MNRDPVSGLTQRRSMTNEEQPTTSSSVMKEAEKETSGEIDFIEENEEERQALELAIQRSLEDQQKPTLEVENDLSIATESSSDSDGK